MRPLDARNDATNAMGAIASLANTIKAKHVFGKVRNRMIRIGSIGAGNRGRIVKLANQPDEGSVLVGICDRDAQVRDEYQQEFGSELLVCDDYRELLDRAELDAVFITTPDYLHEEHAVAALERGLAVYLEKPMAITIQGCDRILDTAQRYGGKLYVGHNMRFFPVMQKIKEIIDEGTIGQVQAVWCRHFVDYGGDAYFKDWHSEQRYSTGLLLQKGAHDIDMIHWFGGGYTRRVVGMGKLSVYNQVKDRRADHEQSSVAFNKDNWPPLTQKGLSPLIDVEDHSMMLMQLDNGVQASYTQCHYTPDGQRNYTIIGTQGRIENYGDHSSDEHEAQIHLWTKRIASQLNQHQTITIPTREGSHGGADPEIINDFLRFVRTGHNDGATPNDARMSVAAGVLATQSIRQHNQPFDVKPRVHTVPERQVTEYPKIAIP